MRKNHFIISLLLAVALMASCNSETKITTYSEALITTFYFAPNDSFPGLKEAEFTVVTSSDTGYIYAKDSLRFGTCLDSVVVRMNFNHTPSYSMIYTASDTILYSGSDTLNLNERPFMIYVMASDQETYKWYTVDFHVHQIDPDLYTWTRLTPSIFTLDGAENKALYSSGTFYLFVNDGMRTLRYTSNDAISWSAPIEVIGLPAHCSVRQMIESNGIFYYADASGLYTSTTGLLFSLTDYSSAAFTLQSMLYSFNDSLWAVASLNADQSLTLVNMPAGGTFAQAQALPDNFPVSDFATLTFESAAGRARAMIMGGYDRNGEPVNMRWNVEFLQNRGYSMGDFSVEQPAFESLAGISLVNYDHAIHMFGGVNKDMEVNAVTQLVSYDEGMHWAAPDSTKNALPAEYLPRQKTSVIVTPDHYIYLIGGQSRTTTFSDVWRGRLNRTLFSDYE